LHAAHNQGATDSVTRIHFDLLAANKRQGQLRHLRIGEALLV
jgi:hypothetical protein